MLKTATLTWDSFPNYGTMLQAYALQQYLLSEGHENHIIDDSSIVFPSFGRKSKQNLWKYRLKRFWQSLHANYRHFYRLQRVYCPKMEDFKKRHLLIDYNVNDVLSDKADYDLYICGSDQIWNPTALINPCRKFFFADFTKRKKISYAPSIGLYSVPTEWKETVRNLISSFSSLSVREQAGKEALQELTEKDIHVVVDPTMLLDKEQWEKCIPSSTQDEKYVLGYLLTPNDVYLQAIKDYAKRSNLKLYLFFLDLSYYGKADKLITGGPFDFLSFIKNAEIVFTDSFHGTIFSYMLRTPFYTLRRFKENSKENQNSRIETLLHNMDATYLLLDESNCNDISCPYIDFDHIRESLAPFIEKSKQYLQKALYEADM